MNCWGQMDKTKSKNYLGHACPRCGKPTRMIYGSMNLCLPCKKEVEGIKREGYRDSYLKRLQKERGKRV